MVTLTDMRIAHYDQALALWRRCEGIGLSGADAHENIQSFLARNPGMSFVALDEQNVVGSILCGHDGRRGYIYHLAVDPGLRRQGIARALADKSLGQLARAGIQKCHLFIYHTNENGRLFWENSGWTWRQDISVMSLQIKGGQ